MFLRGRTVKQNTKNGIRKHPCGGGNGIAASNAIDINEIKRRHVDKMDWC